MGFGNEFNPFQPGGKGFGRELDKLRESIPDSGKRSVGETLGREATLQDAYSAIHRALVRRLVEFEDQLPQDEEAAMLFQSLGQPIQLRVADVSHYQPGLFVFSGEGESGRPMEVVQHAHMLSFVLTGVPRRKGGAPRQEKPFRRQLLQFSEKLDAPSPPQSPEQPPGAEPRVDPS